MDPQRDAYPARVDDMNSGPRLGSVAVQVSGVDLLRGCSCERLILKA